MATELLEVPGWLHDTVNFVAPMTRPGRVGGSGNWMLWRSIDSKSASYIEDQLLCLLLNHARICVR